MNSNETKNNKKRRVPAIIPKAVCVLLALILWLYVMDTVNPDWEQTFEDVPITLVSTEEIEIDNGLTIYKGYSNTVDITVRGRKTEIAQYSVDDFTVTADVISITEAGEYTLPITVEVPGELELITQSVAEVDVFVDKKASVTVPVKTKFTDLIISSEYSLGDPTVSVSSITATGPSRYLTDIEYAEVSIPDLGRVSGSLTVYANVNLIDKDGAVVTSPFVSMSQTEVSVTIPVFAYKDVPLSVAYKYGYLNDTNSSVSLSEQTVYVKGDAAIVDALESIVVTTIDEKKVDDNETFSVAVIMPDGIENLSGTDFVDVTITHIGTTTRMMMLPADYLVINNPNGVNYVVKDKYIAVTLRGENSALYSLAYLSVVPHIDLSSYSTEQSGTFTVPVKIEISSSNGGIYELGEYSIEIELGTPNT